MENDQKLGGALYESMLKPLVGAANVQDQVRTFWLVFAGLGVVAMFGLLMYNKYFAEDTPKTNQMARIIMIGIYAMLIVVGVVFFYNSVANGEMIQYKTMVQAIIMMLIGAGGFFISVRPAQNTD